MSRAARSVLVSALVVVGMLGISAPAHADHVIDLVGESGELCRLGGLESGIGVDLYTADIKTRVMRDGLTTTYVCRFTNIPEYVDSPYGEWHRPHRAVVDHHADCWRPEFEGRETGDGRIIITPNGTAMVICHFRD